VVVRTTNSQRSAFTLIELIFAIVIIAITVLSLPMMTRVTQKGIESSIIQEAIFAASAELMSATSGYWDENSMQDMNVSHLSRVIDIANDCNDTTKLRPGHINQPFHRRCLDSMAINANDTAGGSVFDLNDPATGISHAVFINPNPEAAGYKDNYNSTLTISRTNNVKFLESNIYNTKTPPELIVKLKIQSANVGEIDFYKRMF